MTVEMFKDKLIKEQIILSDQQLKQFALYAELLIKWNEVMNLTAITALDAIYEKHFYDSILPFIHCQPKGVLCDVGSGAGFPGLVLKIVFPELKVILLEPIKKRVRFLEQVIKELNLEGINVINQRAEQHAQTKREYYDWVTARAVANLAVLVELCVPLVKVNGYFMALKGSNGEEEYRNAKRAIKLVGAKLNSIEKTELSDGSLRFNLLLYKQATTDRLYPRSYAQIKNRPL
ncbi:MAG: 16S rRNA (guanine(527)-N(7))-methyltransferase RsmG [Erysipelotrichaceae bacterium]|nr:16S rRNA (guanine(527)-N(7))-methyltransferase RsmG [Erysipelotrichaceae bacterium]